MAQQVFDQYVPVARFGPNPQDTIPVVAAIAQTRDGKDELLLGNVPFVPGPGGLYVPVSASNRLPVEATLSGSKTTLLPRAVRTTSVPTGVIVPSGAKHAVVYHYVHSVTGTFASGEGYRLSVGVQSSIFTGTRWFRARFDFQTTSPRLQGVFIGPGHSAGDGIAEGADFLFLPVIPQDRLRFQLDITGSFTGSEGIDSEMYVVWV